MNWFDSFIFILIFYNLIIDFALQIKAPNKEKQQAKSSPKARSNLDISINVISCFLYAALIILIIWSKLFPYGFGIVLILIPGWIIYLNSILGSSASLIRVLLEKSESTKISLRDKLNIDIIAILFLSYRRSFSLNIITNYFSKLQWCKNIIETALTCYYFLYTFLITLFLIIELMTPIKRIRKHFTSLYNLTIKAHNYIVKRIDELNERPFIVAHYTKNTLFFGTGLKLCIRVVFYILLIPISYIIDIIIGFFKFVYKFLFLDLILLLIDIVIYFGKAILYLLNLVVSIPGNKMIKNTFKFSGILSSTIIIIFMRLSIFYLFDDSFITIIEFIASAIIIPMMFEWIYTTHNENDSVKQISSNKAKQQKSND